MVAVRYDFTPEPKQALALATTNVDELFYGGAAGGGKSRWGRAEVVRMALLVPGSRSAIFRRTHPQLRKDVVPKLRAEMPPGVATFNKSESTWYFHNGSIIELGHMANEDDYYDYQSAEYQLLVFEELTQFLEVQYRYLMSRLRASGTVKARMAELGWRPRMIATGNPGGIGHSWVKQRFVDAGVTSTPWRPEPTPEDPKPGVRCFIPAKLADNPHIDEDYSDKLDQLEPIMARALKDGDWDILKGVRFTQFRRSVHVIEPEEFPIPLVGYPLAVGVDYGSEAPFCALWGALLPDNLVIVYRELYKTGLTPSQQAAMIEAVELPEERMTHRPIPIALDPSTWIRAATQLIKAPDPTAPPPGSIAWYYRQQFGGQVVKARNDRVPGWALIDEHLRLRPGPNPLPRLLIYSTCTNLIRTLPSQMRAKNNPEDIDTHAEDHAADALRYLLMQLIRGGHERSTPGLTTRTQPPITAGVGSKLL